MMDDVTLENEVVKKIELLSSHNKRIFSNEKCSKVFTNLKRKCDNCSSLVRKFYDENMNSDSVGIYQFTGISIEKIDDAEMLEVRPLIKMAEPVLLNPNSYENVEKILKNVKNVASIGTDRHWVFLGCDGPPYCLAERIRESRESLITCRWFLVDWVISI